MMFPTTLLTLLGVVSTLSLATPVKRTVSHGAVINKDFPDPGITIKLGPGGTVTQPAKSKTIRAPAIHRVGFMAVSPRDAREAGASRSGAASSAP